MSLYANYIKEKTTDHILESEHGFLTYRYLDEDKSVYIIDLYVMPDFRKIGIASAMADHVVAEAKLRGCTKLLGSVVPSNKYSTDSLKVLLAYGMILESASNDFVIFKKEI
jgi:ribosomal protein S18 acetylase RimI-like enzyme